MKKVLILVLVIFLTPFISCKVKKGEQKVQKEEKLNIVYIAVDDLNRWIGALGGQAKTPNIDRLASQGMLFTNAHCVVPACNPSRVAIMTGLRPETTGQYTNPGNFRNKPGNTNRITMPQYLSANGYESVSAGKIFHNAAGKGNIPDPQSDPQSWNYQFPNNVGTSGHKLFLDENNQAKWLEGVMYKEGMNTEKPEYLSKFGVWGVIPQKIEETADYQNAAFSAGYLSKTHNKPFFLACGIFRPHSPQLAPQEFFDMYPLESLKVPELPEDDMDDIPEHMRKNFSSEFVGHVKAKNQLQKALQGYLASVSFADACIGKVLEGLENGPNKGNTIVVLWTDHGWQLGHKERWEKFSLWDIATNTPLIIKHPKKDIASKRVNQPVSLLDLYPTVMDFVGLEKPSDLEGVSLAPFIENENYQRPEPAIITYEEGNQSVRKNELNYIHYKNGTEELYDHSKDKMEYNNIVEDENYAENKEALKKWLDKINTKN